MVGVAQRLNKRAKNRTAFNLNAYRLLRFTFFSSRQYFLLVFAGTFLPEG
jgi:hypothetical protein